MTHWPVSAEEFTERYSLPTVRSLSTAMTASLLIHGLALAVVLIWFNQQFQPTTAAIAPVFDVTLSRANADADSGDNKPFAVDTTASPREQVAAPAIDTPKPKPEATEVEIASTEIEPVDSAQTSAVESITATESASVQRAIDALLVTESSSDWQRTLFTPELDPEPDSGQSEAIAMETRPIAEPQQEMLQQQVREWQDDFDILDVEQNQITWQQGNQMFYASLEQQPAHSNTEFERALVEISTEVDGVKLSTQMEFKRLAFSHYAQLIDRWDPNVALSEDEINGRFHSNSQIIVAPERSKKPKFNGKVTVASSVSMRGLSRRSDIFLGGLETRVKRIQLPRQLLPIKSEVDTDTINQLRYQFDQDGQVEFLSEGGFRWSTATADEFFACPGSCFIDAGENVVLSVEGIVKGTVVVTAAEKIRITGNLVYSEDPRKITDAQDFLCLLSDNYIEIAPPEVTGPGDLTIQGALYANRRFVVRNFRKRNRGLLTIFGSLTAGSLTASEPRFATRLQFDQRFEDRRLPNFPMTDKFELDHWEPVWTLEQNQSTTSFRDVAVP